jgi:hypothetical protein
MILDRRIASLSARLSGAILDGGLSYEIADDGGSAIWMEKGQTNHARVASVLRNPGHNNDGHSRADLHSFRSVTASSPI